MCVSILKFFETEVSCVSAFIEEVSVCVDSTFLDGEAPKETRDNNKFITSHVTILPHDLFPQSRPRSLRKLIKAAKHTKLSNLMVVPVHNECILVFQIQLYSKEEGRLNSGIIKQKLSSYLNLTYPVSRPYHRFLLCT